MSLVRLEFELDVVFVVSTQAKISGWDSHNFTFDHKWGGPITPLNNHVNQGESNDSSFDEIGSAKTSQDMLTVKRLTVIPTFLHVLWQGKTRNYNFHSQVRSSIWRRHLFPKKVTPQPLLYVLCLSSPTLLSGSERYSLLTLSPKLQLHKPFREKDSVSNDRLFPLLFLAVRFCL